VWPWQSQGLQLKTLTVCLRLTVEASEFATALFHHYCLRIKFTGPRNDKMREIEELRITRRTLMIGSQEKNTRKKCFFLATSHFDNIPILGTLNKIFCMAKNTSVLLGKHFEDFIAKEVSSGRYSSVSEVIRTGLRLLEEEEKKRKLLKKAIQAGIKSGFVEDFNPEAHLKSLNENYLKSRKKKAK
jgi:antitoxin ParD1/3/4